MTFHWSPQQAEGMKKAVDWYRSGGAGWFYLAGYAGTGKTTITHHVVDEIGAKPCYAAYTGKAASVMRDSGCKGAGTLHSKIYKFKRDPATGEIKKSIDRSKDSPIKKADLIVVDECSMVDAEIGKDLLSFKKPIIVLGDPAQLPPVKGAGYFTSRDPDVMLTEIHRQAEGNPIIALASKARQGEPLEPGAYGESNVVSREQFRAEHDITAFDQVLVGLRKTRAAYNTRLREIKGFRSPYPQRGDRIICRKNDRDMAIFNGQMFEVLRTFDATFEHEAMIGIEARSDDEDREIRALVRSEFFTGDRPPDWRELRGTQQFEYGYALTTHMAQGSQWDRVVVFDESFGKTEDRQRWLYTAITRAAKAVTIVR
jgi:exodeoxyribonuclease-5